MCDGTRGPARWQPGDTGVKGAGLKIADHVGVCRVSDTVGFLTGSTPGPLVPGPPAQVGQGEPGVLVRGAGAGVLVRGLGEPTEVGEGAAYG